MSLVFVLKNQVSLPLIYIDNELSSVTLSLARLQSIQIKCSLSATLFILLKRKEKSFFNLASGVLLNAWIFFFFDAAQNEFTFIMPLNHLGLYE